jgi:hypothetical protein
LSKRGPEYVGVISVIVSELEFSDVQMQILFADLMEGANDAALQDRPEAFDGLRVNSADDVLMRSVVWSLNRLFRSSARRLMGGLEPILLWGLCQL